MSKIFYHDIGDYLSREQKLEIVKKFHSVANMQWTELTPNQHGDWIAQRNDAFSAFIPLEPEKKFDAKAKSFFTVYSLGIATNKDAWVYNFSTDGLMKNVADMIQFYNEQRKEYLKLSDNKKSAKDFVEYDARKISWTDMFLKDLENNKEYNFDKSKICSALYRPFTQQQFCYEKQFMQRTYQQTKIFPTKNHKNLLICITGTGVNKDFSVLITDVIPDLQIQANGQCFPLYYYKENNQQQKSLFDTANESKYIRRDAVSDWILERARKAYGVWGMGYGVRGTGNHTLNPTPHTLHPIPHTLNKEDIFYYVYGFLHSPKYREIFAADLKKMLPRIPLVDDVRDFWAFSRAGRALAELHLNYENVPKHPQVIEIHEPLSITDALKQANKEELEYIDYRVEQMRFPRKGQKDVIIYNSRITLENIPPEAYDYVVNGKPAIEWIMERYAVATHKESGIRNDPNDWAVEQGKPRYILDLLHSVINLSVQTVEIVKGLPEVKFE